MAPMPITLSDLEHYLCLHVNTKVHMACKFRCFVEIAEFRMVTGTQVQCKCGNISETVQDRDIVTNRK